MSLLEKVKDYLWLNVLSTHLIFGENLFINYYPDNPDLIVSIIDGGGNPPDLYTPVREKVVEIKIRAASYEEGSSLGNQIMNFFHNKENYYLDDLRVLHSYASTDVNFLYSDSKERDEFSLELVFLIERK